MLIGSGKDPICSAAPSLLADAPVNVTSRNYSTACPDLLGAGGWRWRVLRTSNAYSFCDPSPAADRPNSSKAKFQAGTPNQKFFSSLEAASGGERPGRSGRKRLCEGRRGRTSAPDQKPSGIIEVLQGAASERMGGYAPAAERPREKRKPHQGESYSDGVLRLAGERRRWHGSRGDDRVGDPPASEQRRRIVSPRKRPVPDPSRLPPMGELTPEPAAATPGWEMMRTDALAFIGAAFNCSEGEAAKEHLLEYAAALPSSAWRCRPEFSQDGEQRGVDLAAVGHAFPTYFWREVRESPDNVELEGNSAIYRGPPFSVERFRRRDAQHPDGPHPILETLHVDGGKRVEFASARSGSMVRRSSQRCGPTAARSTPGSRA